MIALSIAFVAVEIVHVRQGRQKPDRPRTLARGLCFRASPRLRLCRRFDRDRIAAGQIPLALLFFNVGVEIGQLVFVGAVLALIALIRSRKSLLPARLTLVPPYAIGTIAMFWGIERVAAF